MEGIVLSIDKELNHKLFIQRSEERKHFGFQNEFNLYTAIISGNDNEVKRARESYINAKKYNSHVEFEGILSHDPIRNQKYHFVVLASLITRFCVEAGLDREVAYNLCDLFIQKVDLCTSINQINEIRTEMIYKFTSLMKDNKKKGVYSRQVSKCIDYIYDNLYKNISLGEIADNLKVNPNYLSKLFSKEVGISISAYIKKQRLQTAANMLRGSDYAISEIAGYLCFSSQSHFTNSFKHEFGMTPKKYRDTYTTKLAINKMLETP